MANTTLSSVTLHGGSAVMQENTSRKEALISPMPLYLKDSDETDVFDFGGTIKMITMSGYYVGTSLSDCKTSFVDPLEALINGQQTVANGYPLTLTDDLRGTIKVKVMDVETTNSQGQANVVTWTAKLVQSSTVG